MDFFVQDDNRTEDKPHPIKKVTFYPDIDDYDEETHDSLIGIISTLPNGDLLECVRIIERKRYLEVNQTGRRSLNPNKDTTVYQVDVLNRSSQEYMATLLIKNMTSKYDKEIKYAQIF